jgi:hypothetical protein
MNQKEKKKEVWYCINQNSIEFMETNFEFVAPVLIKHLFTSVNNEKKFEIEIFEDKLENSSRIIYNKSNNPASQSFANEGELDLRLQRIDKFNKRYKYSFKTNSLQMKLRISKKKK